MPLHLRYMYPEGFHKPAVPLHLGRRCPGLKQCLRQSINVEDRRDPALLLQFPHQVDLVIIYGLAEAFLPGYGDYAGSTLNCIDYGHRAVCNHDSSLPA